LKENQKYMSQKSVVDVGTAAWVGMEKTTEALIEIAAAHGL
jgi:hypothetical protein